MSKVWALHLLVLGVGADLQAMQLSADGEAWHIPDHSRRLMRHQKSTSMYLQQGSGPGPGGPAERAVNIASNETATMEAFLKDIQAESATASSGAGLALIGTLLCAMTLFYLVTQPHKDLQISTWQLLSGNVALFCTVILFMALKKLWKCVAGTTSEWIAIGYALSFLKFALLMFFFPMLRSKLQDKRSLAALRTSGAYLIGYAGSDSFAYILSVEPFSSGAGYYFLGLLVMFGVLSGMLILAFRLAQRLQPGEDYDPEKEAEQIEAAGFQTGFLVSVWLRFLVTGFMPGSKTGARALILDDLTYLGIVLVLAILTFVLMMVKVRPLADQTERRPVFRRLFRLLTEASAMTMGWLLMYWVQWAWWYSLQGPDGSHNAGKHFALMSQAVTSAIMVYIGMVALFFLAKRSGKNASDFPELTNAWVLQTGFCWEVAIYGGLIDAHSATYPSPLGRRLSAVVCILLLLASILPAWYWYIVPRASEKADGKGEEAGKGEAEGKDTAPEKPAATKEAEPKAQEEPKAAEKEDQTAPPAEAEPPEASGS